MECCRVGCRNEAAQFEHFSYTLDSGKTIEVKLGFCDMHKKGERGDDAKHK